MAKTLSQGRKPGSGRRPGKGKTLRNGRKPGSGRRRRDEDESPSPPQQPQPQPQRTVSTTHTTGKTTAAAAAAASQEASANSSTTTSTKAPVSSRDLEAIDALRELNNSPPQPLTPTLTPTQSKGRNSEIVQNHTNEGPFVTHTRLLSNPSSSSLSNSSSNTSSSAWNSIAHPQPINGLAGMNSMGLGEVSNQQDQNPQKQDHGYYPQSKEGPNGLLIRSYI